MDTAELTNLLYRLISEQGFKSYGETMYALQTYLQGVEGCWEQNAIDSCFCDVSLGANKDCPNPYTCSRYDCPNSVETYGTDDARYDVIHNVDDVIHLYIVERQQFSDYFDVICSQITWVDAVRVVGDKDEGDCSPKIRINTHGYTKWEDSRRLAFIHIVRNYYNIRTDDRSLKDIVREYNSLPWRKYDMNEVENLREQFEDKIYEFETHARNEKTVEGLQQKRSLINDRILKGLSDKEIAVQVGETAKAIRAWRDFYEMPTSTHIQKMQRAETLESSFNLDAARRAYVSGKKNAEIASAAGTNEKTISKWRSYRDLPLISQKREQMAVEWGMKC